MGGADTCVCMYEQMTALCPSMLVQFVVDFNITFNRQMSSREKYIVLI